MFKIFVLLMMFVSGQLFAKNITIGAKNFSESVILSEMISQVLEENHGFEVERKFTLGGTNIAFDALKNGSIDLYPEYTGTGYVMILKQDVERDPNVVFSIVSSEFKKQFDLVWSKPLGFSNTYALAVRNKDERFKNIAKTSELSAKVKNYRFGTPHEFMERKDGFPRYSKLYQLNFKASNIISMDSGLTYEALNSESVDMIMSYSTDGRLKAYDLRIIEDDLRFFPPYDASFLVRENALKKFPILLTIFDQFANSITNDEMTEMNDLVDRLHHEPRMVARNFLIKKGLLKGMADTKKVKNDFLSFAKSNKKYVLDLLKQHLILSLGALLLAFCLSLPVGIFLTRKPSVGNFVFPFINTVQTIPSLALLGFLIPFIGIGTRPAVVTLVLYSLLPLIRNIYAGIMGVEKDYIEASRGMGLTNWQILRYVELPLAMPFIFAGLRTSAVVVIGTTTIAAMIGAGGFGDPIFRGVATANSNLILLGAIPVAILAVSVDKLIGVVEKMVVSKGIAK